MTELDAEAEGLQGNAFKEVVVPTLECTIFSNGKRLNE
jgi:hypothetical protein